MATKLRSLIPLIRTGDPTNVEARAAKIFWTHWLPADSRFRRDADGDDFNGLLNYGYAIVRAALARTIVSAGYSPALGIHHHHRSNPFCLADDLIEPLRPMVDAKVRRLHEQGYDEVNRETKEVLLSVLTDTVHCDQTSGPLSVVLHRYVSNFGDCLRGESPTLHFPVSTPRDAEAT